MGEPLNTVSLNVVKGRVDQFTVGTYVSGCSPVSV